MWEKNNCRGGRKAKAWVGLLGDGKDVGLRTI